MVGEGARHRTRGGCAPQNNGIVPAQDWPEWPAALARSVKSEPPKDNEMCFLSAENPCSSVVHLNRHGLVLWAGSSVTYSALKQPERLGFWIWPSTLAGWRV